MLTIIICSQRLHQSHLAEGNLRQAIVIARRASDGFLRGDDKAHATEALTTEGKALARSGDSSTAEIVLRRAITVAETVGDLEGAGCAALILMEELDGFLTTDRMYELYVSAENLLSRTSDQELTSKLQSSGHKLIMQMKTALDSSRFEEINIRENVPQEFETDELDFTESVQHYESKIIEWVLRKSENRVTHAAKILKVSHQHLSLMLRTRHKNLLFLTKQPTNQFKPRSKRRQTIIREKVAK